MTLKDDWVDEDTPGHTEPDWTFTAAAANAVADQVNTNTSKLAGIEANADVTDATNVDAAGAVMNADTSTASMSFVVDEDTMSSNSATKIPTQQSVKAYVDTNVDVLASRIITPEDFGAVGDGSTDDTDALQDALDALGPGETLLVEAGKAYAHESTLDWTTSGGTITGGGEIRATVENTSGFKIQGDYCTVENVTFTCPTTTTRGAGFDHGKISVIDCVGTTLRRVTVDGAKGAGLAFCAAHYFQADECRVVNTLADGLLVSSDAAGPSSHGVLSNCRAEDTGDDAFSVVSYAADGDACSDIINTDFYVKNSGARGIAVVGGVNVQYRDGVIDGSVAAGIYVACEPGYATNGVTDVVIDSIHVSNANIGAPSPEHAGVFIWNGRDGFNIDRVTVRDITLYNTDTGTSRQVAIFRDGTGTITNVILAGQWVYAGTGPTTRLATFGTVEYWADTSVTEMSAIPATATSAGTPGQMAADASWLYVCTAADVWRRVAIASW